MGFIGWIIIGGIAGMIASALMGENQGCLLNIIVGIVGGVVGGLVFNLLGGIGVTGFNLYSLIVATVGAILFLGIVRLLRRR